MYQFSRGLLPGGRLCRPRRQLLATRKTQRQQSIPTSISFSALCTPLKTRNSKLKVLQHRVHEVDSELPGELPLFYNIANRSGGFSPVGHAVNSSKCKHQMSPGRQYWVLVGVDLLNINKAFQWMAPRAKSRAKTARLPIWLRRDDKDMGFL
jgi:hypothetical protein